MGVPLVRFASGPLEVDWASGHQGVQKVWPHTAAYLLNVKKQTQISAPSSTCPRGATVVSEGAVRAPSRMVASTSSTICSDQDSLSELGGEAGGLLRMEDAVRVILRGLGEDLDREGLKDTPRRVAKAWLDVSSGYRKDLYSVVGTALFHEPVVTSGMVVVRNIDFASTSEHTLLPFSGRVHIAYVPSNGVVLGLSKVARVAKLYASRLQSQQRLTNELLAAFHQQVAPQGAAVVVEALHMSEGPSAQPRLTSALCGCFAKPGSHHLREFQALLQLHGVSASLAAPSLSAGLPGAQALCKGHATALVQPATHSFFSGGSEAIPSAPVAAASIEPSLPALPEVVQEMEDAMNCILREIGVDPTVEGLQGSARRYVEHQLRWCSGHHSSSAGQLLPSPAANGCSGLNGTMRCATQQPVECHLRFSSQCEHHMLPFHGLAHVVYVPGLSGRRLSTLQTEDILRVYSRRLQIQERLTNELADALTTVLDAAGMLVVCEAVHMCMVARGVEKHASTTITLASRGCLAANHEMRTDLLCRLTRTRTQ